MTKIQEILSLDSLADEVAAGYVRIQRHPEFPELAIANYTDLCAYERHWNDVTKLTRGLIWSTDTEEVLARPFPKFFNFDEKEAPRILDDQIVYAWDNKYDGSLGIMYQRPDGEYALATRGSFASEQAKLGTKLLLQRSDLDNYTTLIDNGFTPLFEICGPDNRIVLDYKENFTAYLGAMSIADGFFVPANPQYDKRTMRSLLMDLSNPNTEGWVVWKTAFEAVKIKQADYVELHRIVSNLSEKEIWRQLRAGTYDEFIVRLPDEWHAWADNIANSLKAAYTNLIMGAWRYTSTVEALELPTRKEQAAWIIQHVEPTRRGLVFSLLDGKSPAEAIWRILEPKGV